MVLIEDLYKQNIITNKWKVNSNIFRWWKNKELSLEIINNTYFLNENCELNERLYCIVNKITHSQKCKYCNNWVRFNTFTKWYSKYCSPLCRWKDPEIKDKIEKTNIKKYWTKCSLQSESSQEKTRITSLEKYDTEYSQSSEPAKAKRIKTNFLKFNTPNPFWNEDIKEKIRQTNLLIFGSENPFSNKGIKEKIRQTNLKKHYVENPWKAKKIIEKRVNTYKKNKRNSLTYHNYINLIKDKFSCNITEDDFIDKWYNWPYSFTCKKCNNIIKDNFIYNPWSKRTARCFNCEPKFNWTSNSERDIVNFIKSFYNKEIIINNRKILKWKEIDVYLPNDNIAIEYNWLIWHSVWDSTFNIINNSLLENKIKDKHLYKTTECNNLWIQLLHIFDSEWLNARQRNIWKNIIKTKLWHNEKIYARKTYIKELSNKESFLFLNENHLQSNFNSASIRIGLFNKENNELISLMTFWKARFTKSLWEWTNKPYELLRFATKWGLSIIWGAWKILKYFSDNYLLSWNRIITYADLRFSNGNVYEKIGFNKIWQSKPNYFYFKNGTYNLESRIRYQKHKLKDLLDNFDENLSESQNMYNNGYRKIYDSWNLVFEYIKE